jgi:hypothetical protein
MDDRISRIERQMQRLTIAIAVLIVVVGGLCVRACFGASLGMTPAKAVLIARDDAQAIGHEAKDTYYYLNLSAALDSHLDIGAFSYSWNMVTATAATPQLLVRKCDEMGYVLAVNVRQACPRDIDYDRVRLLLETLASRNFYFHSIDPDFFTQPDGITVDKNVAADHSVLRPVPPFVLQGKKFSARHFAKYTSALHLAGLTERDLSAYDELRLLTGSENPIMLMDQFVSIAHRAAGDGLYYDLANIPGTEKELDAQVGVDFAAAEKLRSDQRAVMWRRRLNDRPSMIEWAVPTGIRATDGLIPVIYTRDYANRRAEARIHPIQNILDRTHAASRSFHPKPNMHLLMGLWDGQGNRQDVAPGNIAIDDSISPCVEVEAGLCFRCHAPSGFFHPLENHLLSMTQPRVGVEGLDGLPLRDRFRKLGIIDDLGSKTELEETLDRAAGLYEGDPKDMLAFARLAHAKAVIKSTGGVFGLDPVQKACDRLALIFDRYELQPVNPLQACYELGIVCKTDEEAQKILSDVALELYPDTFGISPETPALWALITWKEGSLALPKRQDWENEYATLMVRVTNALRAGTLKL